MKYILLNDSTNLLECEVPPSESRYLQAAISSLEDLSDAEYLSSVVVVLRTSAKYSYVLDGINVLWLIEWQPGLIVVKFSPTKRMQWTAIRSPIPDFGGRIPLPPDDCEDIQNPQYDLIYTSFDAAIDPDCTENFSKCDPETVSVFNAALAHVNSLEEKLKLDTNGEKLDWTEQCFRNIELRCGQGRRINTW
jgi:hypothetical protein